MFINMESLKKLASQCELPEPPQNIIQSTKEHYLKKFDITGYEDRVGKSDKIAEYFARYWIAKEYEEYKPEMRGLYLVGDNGTGKTMALERLAALFKLPFFTAQELTEKFAIGGDTVVMGIIEECKSSDIIIDDLGFERNTSYYGNSGIMVSVLANRYNLWKLSGVRTHYSSNCDEENLVDLYGIRIVSRLSEQCAVISLTGEDQRRLGKPPLTNKRT